MFEKLLEKLDNYLKKKSKSSCCHCADGKGNCQNKDKQGK